MSAATKESLARWMPVLFYVLTNLAVIAYGYGKVDQRIIPLEHHVSMDTTENAMKLFPTKAEFEMRNTTRDKELNELRQDIKEFRQELRDNNARMDKIIDRLQQVK